MEKQASDAAGELKATVSQLQSLIAVLVSLEASSDNFKWEPAVLQEALLDCHQKGVVLYAWAWAALLQRVVDKTDRGISVVLGVERVQP